MTATRSGYSGRILAPAGGGDFAYYTDGDNPAVAVYAVENTSTGEVRFFREDALAERTT